MDTTTEASIYTDALTNGTITLGTESSNLTVLSSSEFEDSEFRNRLDNAFSILILTGVGGFVLLASIGILMCLRACYFRKNTLNGINNDLSAKIIRHLGAQPNNSSLESLLAKLVQLQQDDEAELKRLENIEEDVHDEMDVYLGQEETTIPEEPALAESNEIQNPYNFFQNVSRAFRSGSNHYMALRQADPDNDNDIEMGIMSSSSSTSLLVENPFK